MRAWIEVVEDTLTSSYETEVGWRVFLGAGVVSAILRGHADEETHRELADLIVISDVAPDKRKSCSGWWFEIPLEEV